MITGTGWGYSQVQRLPFPVALELLDFWREHSEEYLLQKIRAILKVGLGVEEKDSRPGHRTPGKLSPAEQQAAGGNALPRSKLPEYIRKTLVM